MAALRLELGLSGRVREALQGLLKALSGDRNIAEETLAKLHSDTVKGSKDLEDQVFSLVMANRDPRWEQPVPDPFFQKRLDCPVLIQGLWEASKDSQSSTESLVKEIKTCMEKLDARETLVNQELAKEELAVQAKITSETLSTGFDKTVRDFADA